MGFELLVFDIALASLETVYLYIYDEVQNRIVFYNCFDYWIYWVRNRSQKGVHSDYLGVDFTRDFVKYW